VNQAPPAYPLFKPQGEAALLCYLGRGIDPAVNGRLRALARALREEPAPGLRETLAAYCCLQVQFDPLVTDHEEMEAWVRQTLERLPQGGLPPGRRVSIPLVYGGEHGPDLEFVARHAGLNAAEVIARHTGREHLCHMVGFTPGFPFLGGLDPLLAAPRLDSPRSDLPVGAVGVGGDQTGLYPLGGPGGWRIMGRTPELVYDPRRDPPCLIEAGDLVSFRAIAEAEFPLPPKGELAFDERGLEMLQVISPGPLTLVQDAGRWGWQRLGVPVSGALDQFALAAANIMVGNAPGAPALEMALAGPKLRVLREVAVAVAGADLDLRVDGQPAPRWRALRLVPGQVVECRGPKDGARAIMAVAGGLAARPQLGSASAYILGSLGAPLAKGHILRAWPARSGAAPRHAPENLAPAPRRTLTLRAVPGPNQDFFTEAGVATLFSDEFKVSPQADRRGVRLSGPAVELRPGPSSIVSEPNTPGIVQVPPGGAPIILLNEQTVGGYAKAATVIGPDRDLLASALPGDSLRFAAVSPGEAVAVARARARDLDMLRQAVGA
jgi:KipI family sensor histidine kinase inhibitor